VWRQDTSKAAPARVKLSRRVAVMDPFHVVRLAGDALEHCRRRVQQDLQGHRGRKGEPLFTSARTLHTGADLLTDKQCARLTALSAAEEHIEVEATWGIYQPMITAYREPERKQGRDLMTKLIESVSHGVDRAAQARSDPDGPRRRRAGLLRPARHQQRPHRGDQRTPRTPPRIGPRLSATSPTTSPDHSWRAADSDPGYTLDCEEPPWHGVHI